MQEFKGISAFGAEALVAQAKATPLNDGGVQTAELLALALLDDPHHHEAQVLRERLHQMYVPRWHFSMLGDELRNGAYAAAIGQAVKPGDIVLDIGTGAGLTAILAAKAGAKHVYTCEGEPLIAQAAQRVIAQNGLSDRITVLSKMSHDLAVGVDLPEPADVVVSEIVDSVLLGEGALATLHHAMATLAKPGARAVPEFGRLMAQPIESESLFALWRPRKTQGVDLSAFYPFANLAQISPNDLASLDINACGPAHPVFSFDFKRPHLRGVEKNLSLGISKPGVVHAVLLYFEMTLAPGIKLTNDLSSTGHWGRTAFLMDRATPVMPGSTVSITAQHDSAHLSVAIDGVKEEDGLPDVQFISARSAAEAAVSVHVN